VGEIKSTETSLEQQDSVGDQLSEMLERFTNRLCLSNPKLVERYGKSELQLIVEIRVCGIDEKLVALFQRAEFVGGVQEQIKFGKAVPRPHLFDHWLHGPTHDRPDVYSAIRRANGYQQAVLIDVVKSIEGPQFMSFPSSVRFDFAERFYGILPQALYCSSKEGLVLRGVIAKRKVELDVFPSVRPHEKQLPSQMVEGDPEIVDHIPGDRDKFNWDGRKARYVIDRLTGLRIALDANRIWIGCEESLANSVEINEVLFGPFDFDVNPCQFLVGGHF
jgi:hypothetical protein